MHTSLILAAATGTLDPSAAAEAAGVAELTFASPAWLHAVWIGPLLLALAAWSFARTRRTLRRFAEAPMLAHLVTGVRWWRRWLRAALIAAATIALALTLARPQNDPRTIDTPVRGREVVFMLDVSRSMLARDLAPTRLDRAKLWINDLADHLGGDRVGLVAFAGASVTVSPLTLDRNFFRLALDEITPDRVPIGGTKIGDAIRRTMRTVFDIDPADPKPPEAGTPRRDIILITDGEDQDSFPVEAAQAAAQAGVRIIAIGLGGNDTVVPDAEDNGNLVRSSLDSRTLTAIAGADPANVFLPVGTGDIDLPAVYDELVRSAESSELTRTQTVVYTERFVWPLSLALLLLAIDLLVIDRSPRQPPEPTTPMNPGVAA